MKSVNRAGGRAGRRYAGEWDSVLLSDEARTRLIAYVGDDM